jgi:hypothetical protein
MKNLEGDYGSRGFSLLSSCSAHPLEVISHPSPEGRPTCELRLMLVGAEQGASAFLIAWLYRGPYAKIVPTSTKKDCQLDLSVSCRYPFFIRK